MWIYGGMTDLLQKSDFWKYEFDTGNWFRMRSKTGPGEIHSHSATKVMSCMLIFGGQREGVLINELWRYHFGIDVWERIHIGGIVPCPCSRPVIILNQDEDLSPTSMFSDSQSKWSSQTSCAVKTPTSGFPSKSVSMYSSFTSQTDEPPAERYNNKKHFRSKIHPVSRLCSKSMSSDEEEEDMLDKDSGYRSNVGSSRNHSIKSITEDLFEVYQEAAIVFFKIGILNVLKMRINIQAELQNKNSNLPSKRCIKNVYKSHSSDALLEADDESTSSSTEPTDSTKESQSFKKYINGTNGNTIEATLPGSVHKTASFYNIHSCDNGCDELSCCQQNKINANSTLIDFENSPKCPKCPNHVENPPMSAKYEKGDNDEESCHLNVTSPSSNVSNPHKDFAGCLNNANKKRDTSKSNFRYSLNVELKTFTPDSSPYRSTTRLATTPGSQSSIRSKSLDRESQRREHYPLSPHISSTPLQNRNNVSSFYGSQYMKPPPRLCCYVFGGKQEGSKTEYKQPMSCWLLHL
ncbi:hypothetical protein GQR58_028215 [Nymphon striatum]|nr:hypothetical protein GQR58_028215 [Nymphon striatum]